jgi:hypothetical protein
MTWPLAARLGVQLAGGRSDLYVHQWTFWWVKEALLTGQNPFYTDLLYHPHGVALTSHNIAWVNIALWIPLQALIGSIAAYNLIFLGIITLNGFATYFFVYEISRVKTAAFVAGIIYSFWPYTLSHYDHPNMIIVFWAPLTLLLFHRLIKRQTWKLALLTGIVLALVGISRWQLLVMSSPLIIGYWLYLMMTNRHRISRTLLKQWAVAGGIALVLMVPLALPLIADQLTSSTPDDVFIEEPGYTDLFAYFINRETYNALFPELMEEIPMLGEPYHHIAASTYYVPFLGYTIVLLALLGVFSALRERNGYWLWGGLSILYAIFALGPELIVNGQNYPGIPLPYELLQDTLLDALIRRPHRLNLFLGLPVAILASRGVLTLLEQRKNWPRLLITGFVTAVTLLEYNPYPFETTPIEVPTWHQKLAQNADEFALVELPIHDRYYDKWYMFYQTFHGKPIAGGHVSRLPRDASHFLRNNALLAPFFRHEWHINPDLTNVSRQLRLLNAGGFRYLVIHKEFVAEGYLLAWRDWLTIDPMYEDEEVLVYTTTPRAGEDFNFTHSLTPDVGLIRQNIDPITAVPGGALKTTLRLGSAAPPAQALQACLQLATEAEIVHQECNPITPGWNTAVWPANAVIREGHDLWIDETIPPGEYILRLQLADGNGNLQGETAVLGPVAIDPYAPTATANVAWGNEIGLPDYRLEQSEGALNLALYWQAKKEMENQYKFFIHLIDPAGGEIVAQVDAAPRDWRYPTFAWEAGERVHDEVALSLAELPAGEYGLFVGWYDEANGERLPATGPDSEEGETAVRLTTITLP